MLRNGEVCSRWHRALEPHPSSPRTQPSPSSCEELHGGELSPVVSPSTNKELPQLRQNTGSHLFVDYLRILCPSLDQVPLVVEVTKCELHPIRHPLDTEPVKSRGFSSKGKQSPSLMHMVRDRPNIGYNVKVRQISSRWCLPFLWPFSLFPLSQFLFKINPWFCI